MEVGSTLSSKPELEKLRRENTQIYIVLIGDHLTDPFGRQLNGFDYLAHNNASPQHRQPVLNVKCPQCIHHPSATAAHWIQGAEDQKI